jgi:hypothetical protein
VSGAGWAKEISGMSGTAKESSLALDMESRTPWHLEAKVPEARL